MNIKELQKDKYYEDLRSTGGMIFDKYISPSGLYELELIYAGEYPHGDSHHYCQITDKSNNEVIWEYRKGDKIRQISEYPWSPDNRTVYFGLIENGNKIAKYDLHSDKLDIIYKSKQDENRLNWIHFIPQTFNGVVINSNYWIAKEGFVEYVVFINETGEQVELNNFFTGKIFPCPSNVTDCILVIGTEFIYLFNVKEKDIIGKEYYNLLTSGYFPKYKPSYLISTGETYLQLNNQSEEKYIKIK